MLRFAGFHASNWDRQRWFFAVALGACSATAPAEPRGPTAAPSVRAPTPPTVPSARAPVAPTAPSAPTKPAKPALKSESDAGRTACPSGMVLVDGEYCTDVDYECLKSWYDK